ncbi:MAG: thioredoxin [Clostridia bacterium]|nr:thioredoxin [Clostridia bacterium]
MTTALNKDNFDSFINGAGKPVLVDLWASWCGPCRMLSPLVDALAESRSDIAVGKVDVDDNPDIAMRYGVQSIPTLLLFKDGELVDRSVGYVPQAALEAFVAKAL